MKAKINLLLIAIVFTVASQSCKKDKKISPASAATTKLLLSQVTSTIQSSDPNFFPALLSLNYTYNWNSDPQSVGPNTATILTAYSYDDDQHIEQESFANTGHYDFTYDSALPYQVADFSEPGQDYGYWQFYYDSANRIEKVGSAFSAAAAPSYFEFYNRDSTSGQLNSIIFGQSVDEPLMKVVYKYDGSGNVTEFDVYLPSDSPLLPPSPDNTATAINPAVNVRTLATRSGEPKTSLRRRLAKPFQPVIASFDNSQWVLYEEAQITTDGKPNPFSQQGNIFFYQSNRYFGFYDIDGYFIGLLKSNPVKVTYTVAAFGDTAPSATETFTYTYNTAGYPITIHDERSDTKDDFVGSFTQDFKLSYRSIQ